MHRKMAFLGLYVCPFWDSDGGPRGLDMMDMPIPDRYEIGGSRTSSNRTMMRLQVRWLARSIV